MQTVTEEIVGKIINKDIRSRHKIRNRSIFKKSPTENLLKNPVELSLIRETRTLQVLQSHLPLQQWFSLVAEYTFVIEATVNNGFIG